MNDAASPARPAAAEARCTLCGHTFSPGGLRGHVYCARCGRRFNPNFTAEETVNLAPPDAHAATEPAGEPDANLRRDPEVAERAAEGERFGDYDLLSEIARGGMGVVYKARQRNLKRIVALKMLRAGEGASEEDLARFMREAKAAASLSHPNIVPIHELSTQRGVPFFTMDYIEGAPLDRVIEEGGLTPRRAIELTEVIADTIAYAHEHGIIHRDLKPANIIIDASGRPMLTDFGLAVSLSAEAEDYRMTRVGAVMGTIPYIPPEQAAGRVDRIDARSDVYSLGAVLYEMITNRPPFEGETQYELLRRVIHQEPVPPGRLKPRLHPDVETICLKCLEKDPRRRYASAAELAGDCRAFLHGEVISARPAGTAFRVWRHLLRHRTLTLLGVCIALLSLGVLALRHKADRIEKQLNISAMKERRAEVKVQQLSREKEENERQLRRSWRQEFTAAFNEPVDPRRLWVDPVQTRQIDSCLTLSGSRVEELPRGFVAPRRPFPPSFRITCRIRAAVDTPGAISLLINADRRFGLREGAEYVTIGVPGNPGARLRRGAAVLAEDPAFALTPGQWQELELTRVDDRLYLSIDGKEILKTEPQPLFTDAQRNFLALGATGGRVQLEKFGIYVLGLSRSMIDSLLEVAGSLTLQRDRQLALHLYERVAVENAPRDLHLSALHGYARSLVLPQPPDAAHLLGSCHELMAKVAVDRALEPGEEEFLCGLTLAEHPDLTQRRLALDHFGAAIKESRPGLEELFSTEPWQILGPLAAAGPDDLTLTLAPELEFLPAETYAGKNGPVNWRPLGGDENDGRVYAFAGAKADNENAVFYARRIYRCDRDMDALVQTGSDDGLRVWVNGSLILSKNEQRSAEPASEETPARFRAGENAVLVKIHNRKEGAGFSVRVTPRYPDTGLKFYGLFSRLEEALLRLKLRETEAAMSDFATMQRDGSLARLADSYGAELKAENTPLLMLEGVDDLLREGTPAGLATAWGLLESLRTLHPDSAKDLAQRYHRLARLHIDAGRYCEAEAALIQATALGPTWFLPRFDRAALLYTLGRLSDAQSEFAAAIKTLPDSLDLHLAIAGFYLDRTDANPGNLPQARAAAERAIKLSGGMNAQAWELLARILLKGGEPAKAGEALGKALALEDTPERRRLETTIAAAPRPTSELAAPPEVEFIPFVPDAPEVRP